MGTFTQEEMGVRKEDLASAKERLQESTDYVYVCERETEREIEKFRLNRAQSEGSDLFKVPKKIYQRLCMYPVFFPVLSGSLALLKT